MNEINEIENVEGIKVYLAGMKKDISALTHSVECQEAINLEIRELVTSVKLIAQSISQMVDKQKEQDDKIDEVEENSKIIEERVRIIEVEPAKEWSRMKRTAFTAIVGAVCGGLVTILVTIVGI